MLFENNLIYGGDDCLRLAAHQETFTSARAIVAAVTDSPIGPLGKGGASCRCSERSVCHPHIGGIGVADIMLKGSKTLSWYAAVWA
jgi:hypothetical protein